MTSYAFVNDFFDGRLNDGDNRNGIKVAHADRGYRVLVVNDQVIASTDGAAKTVYTGHAMSSDIDVVTALNEVLRLAPVGTMQSEDTPIWKPERTAYSQGRVSRIIDHGSIMQFFLDGEEGAEDIVYGDGNLSRRAIAESGIRPGSLIEYEVDEFGSMTGFEVVGKTAQEDDYEPDEEEAERKEEEDKAEDQAVEEAIEQEREDKEGSFWEPTPGHRLVEEVWGELFTADSWNNMTPEQRKTIWMTRMPDIAPQITVQDMLSLEDANHHTETEIIEGLRPDLSGWHHEPGRGAKVGQNYPPYGEPDAQGKNAEECPECGEMAFYDHKDELNPGKWCHSCGYGLKAKNAQWGEEEDTEGVEINVENWGDGTYSYTITSEPSAMFDYTTSLVDSSDDSNANEYGYFDSYSAAEEAARNRCKKNNWRVVEAKTANDDSDDHAAPIPTCTSCGGTNIVPVGQINDIGGNPEFNATKCLDCGNEMATTPGGVTVKMFSHAPRKAMQPKSLDPRQAVSHRAAHQADIINSTSTDWLARADKDVDKASRKFDPKEEARVLVAGLSIDQLSTTRGTRQIADSVLRARATTALSENTINEFFSEVEKDRRRAYARYTSHYDSSPSTRLAESLREIPDESLFT